MIDGSPVLLLLYLCGISGMILTAGTLLGLSEQYYFLIITFMSALTAAFWFLYIFHNRIFIISSAVFAGISSMIIIPQTFSFSAELKILITEQRKSDSLHIDLFFIVLLIALVTFLLFSLEFVMRMHSILLAVGFSVVILVLLFGQSVSVLNIFLILIFEIGFAVSNMTERRSGKNVMGVSRRKKINMISAVITASVAAASLIPAFIIEGSTEKNLFDLADTADSYIKKTIAKIAGDNLADGVTNGSINRGNLYRTGKSQLSIYINKYPQDAIYLRSYTGKDYSNSNWSDAFEVPDGAPRIGSSEFYDYYTNPYKESFIDGLIANFYSSYGGSNLPYSFHYLIGNSSDPVSEMYFMLAKTTTLNDKYFIPTTLYGQHVLETPPEEEKRGYIFNDSAADILISNIANKDSETVYIPYFSRDSKTRVLSNPDNFKDGYYRNKMLTESMVDLSEQWDRNPSYELFRQWYSDGAKSVYTYYNSETPKLENYCKQITLNSLDEITTYILVTLNNRAVYSTTPGNTPYNKDVIDYFLFDNGKGYCVHYASAAALMYRMFGIPARYVTGYVAQPADFSQDKTYSSYYSAVLTDYSAHAWVEIFLDDYGWVPVEVTPEDDGSMNAHYPGFDMNKARTIMNKYGWHFRSDTIIDTDDTDGESSSEAVSDGDLFFPSVIIFVLSAAAIIAAVIIRRRILLKRFRNANSRRLFDRLIRMLHFSGMLPEYTGSEKDFAKKLSECCPSVSIDRSETLISLMLAVNYSDSEISPQDHEFISEVCTLAAKDIYQKTFPLKKPIFKFIKVFI